jgi:hypothetical protein
MREGWRTTPIIGFVDRYGKQTGKVGERVLAASMRVSELRANSRRRFIFRTVARGRTGYTSKPEATWWDDGEFRL